MTPSMMKLQVMDRESLVPAFSGCLGIFHMATPVEIPLLGENPAPFEEAVTSQITPALEGVRVVFRLAAELGIKRCVLTSSNAAVSFPPPECGVVNESCWSNEEFLQEQSRWYTLAKTQQERLAWRLAEEMGITLQTICPPYIFGPRLSPHLNFSHAVLLECISGAFATIPNDKHIHMVDSRDVATIHVLAYETREPGRFFACAAQPHMREVCEILRSKFPDIADKIPNALSDPSAPLTGAWKQVDHSKCVRLMGRPFKAVEETLVETVSSLISSGDIHKQPIERKRERC
jgi:nucleoside-diphosphate-sugar epimerase